MIAQEFFTLTNQGRFDDYDYRSETPLVREAVINWYEFPARPVRLIFEVQQTIVNYDDNMFISLSTLTQEEEKFYQIAFKEQRTRADSQKPDYLTRLTFSFTMNLNAKNVSRSVYTFWTVLGEVGGFYGILIYLAAYASSVFVYQKSVNHLAGKLYSESNPKVPDSTKLQTKTRLDSAK